MHRQATEHRIAVPLAEACPLSERITQLPFFLLILGPSEVERANPADLANSRGVQQD